MKNIELFDLYCAKIFSELYSNFPVCIDINTQEFSTLESHSFEIKEKDCELIFSETMLWLKNNALISFTNPPNSRPVRAFAYGDFGCVNLTLKGINILRSRASVGLNMDDTVGASIYKHSKKGAYDIAAGVLTAALSSLVS